LIFEKSDCHTVTTADTLPWWTEQGYEMAGRIKMVDWSLLLFNNPFNGSNQKLDCFFGEIVLLVVKFVCVNAVAQF